MSTQTRRTEINEVDFQEELPVIYRRILKNFKKILQSFALFHGAFVSLFAIQLFSLLYYINNVSMAAAILGSLFVTGFSYLVLHLYFQTKKLEKLQELNQKFLNACVKAQSPFLAKEKHLSIGATFVRFSVYLEDFEHTFYKIPSFLQPMQPLCSHLSTVCYWSGVFKFKQILLATAMEEYLKQIKASPTDLAVHASLAFAYVERAKLLRSALSRVSKKARSDLDTEANISSQLAIEEFQILSDFSPNDPWVHEQLIEGYRTLHRPEEELRETQILLQLKPEDRDILFRLGELYFKQGMRAKGLQVYEKLKKSGCKRAESLLASYGNIPSLF